MSDGQSYCIMASDRKRIFGVCPFLDCHDKVVGAQWSQGLFFNGCVSLQCRHGLCCSLVGIECLPDSERRSECHKRIVFLVELVAEVERYRERFVSLFAVLTSRLGVV